MIVEACAIATVDALWRLDGLDHAGIEDPVAALALGPRPQPELLLVGGRPVVAEGRLTTADEHEVAADLERVSRLVTV